MRARGAGLALLAALQGCGAPPDNTCARAVRDVFDIAVCGLGGGVQHEELQWKIYNGICTDFWRDTVIADCKEKCTGKKGVESGHCMSQKQGRPRGEHT